MKDEEGDVIACANTIWSLLDTDSGKPVKVNEDMLKGYALEPRLEMDYAPRKINVPGNCVQGERVQIKKIHLDTNQHVNNGQFIQIAIDSLEESFPAAQLRAEYKKQVLLGDVLTPHVSAEGGKYVIVLKNAEDAVCCVVELAKKKGRKN